MGRRKGWDDLTPTYRRRLERSGITAAAYNSGSPLAAARGHRTTPERPRDAERRPDRYAEYRNRSNLQRIVRELAAAGLAPNEYELDVLKEQFGTAGRRAILSGQLAAHKRWQTLGSESDENWFTHDGPERMEHYSDGEVDISQYTQQLWYHGSAAA